jgi:hypothetical protein
MRKYLLIIPVLLALSCFQGRQYIDGVGGIPDSEAATIYVINPTFDIGLASKNKIYINDILIGSIGRNSHMKIFLADGNRDNVTIWTSARPEGKYEFSVEPNSVHYFEYEDLPTESSRTKPLLRKLTEEDGALLLSQVPRQVALQPR